MNKRLLEICKFVQNNSIVADVGTDHGLIPIHLIENGIAKKVIASDISENSLNKLNEKLYYGSHLINIETRVSDGLDSIREFEVDTLIISGMGGILIKNIIEKNLEIAKSFDTIILSPNNSCDTLRKFLLDNSFVVVDELDAYEHRKYYPILKVKFGKDFYSSDREFLFGKHLIYKKSKNLKVFLDYEVNKYKNILKGINNTEFNKSQIEKIKNKILEMETVLNDIS